MFAYLFVRLRRWDFWWWLSITMSLSKWILRQNFRNMSRQTMSARMDRGFLQWRYLYKTISNSSIFRTFVRRRVWRYQRGNQNPHIEEEQTTIWPKEKVQKDKQRSTKHTHKDRVTRTPLITGVNSGTPEGQAVAPILI